MTSWQIEALARLITVGSLLTIGVLVAVVIDPVLALLLAVLVVVVWWRDHRPYQRFFRDLRDRTRRR